MSHVNIGLKPCPEIQRDLVGHFQTCDPTKLLASHEHALVSFLWSSTNRGMIQEMVSPGRGKKKIVDLVYTPRILEEEISLDPTKSCTAGDNAGMLTHRYELNGTGVSVKESYDIADLADICKDNELWIAERINAMMNGLVRKMEAVAMEDLQAIIGSFAAGETNVTNDVKTVQTKFADGKQDSNFLEELTFAASNAAYCSIPYVFGWNETFKAFKRLEAGCCADSGLNFDELSSAYGQVFLPASKTESVFGANNFVTLAAGAAQPIWWNEFAGAEGINTVSEQSYVRGVLVHPQTGVPFDYLWSDNCGVITIQLKLMFQIEGLPTDMFDAGDRLNGVTQANQYVISNP